MLAAARTEMLNCSITGLWAHCALKPADLGYAWRQSTGTGCLCAWYLESSALEPERDQIQEVYKLTEHDTLRRRVLLAESIQLFHECLDLGR